MRSFPDLSQYHRFLYLPLFEWLLRVCKDCGENSVVLLKLFHSVYYFDIAMRFHATSIIFTCIYNPTFIANMFSEISAKKKTSYPVNIWDWSVPDITLFVYFVFTRNNSLKMELSIKLYRQGQSPCWTCHKKFRQKFRIWICKKTFVCQEC